MKLRTLTVMAVVVLLFACDKESITTKPQLRLKSISANFVPLNSALSFTFEFSDKEGDLSLPLGIKKISASCDDAGFIDTVKFAFPDIPGSKNTDGELEVILTNINLLPIRCHGQDTLEDVTFKFWIRDDAGNVSDTITTGNIQIVK